MPINSLYPTQAAKPSSPKQRQPSPLARIPPPPILPLLIIRIADRIEDACYQPSDAQPGSGARVLEAGDQQRDQELGLVLDEVSVRALGAVEGVGGGVLSRLLGRSVLDRVGDLSGAAVGANVREGLLVGEEESGRGG